MIQSILFDLDDTLLENDIQRFLPAYLQELGSALADRFAPDRMVAALMAGTRAMLANQDPEVTLEAAFDGVFYPMLGAQKQSLAPVLELFYRERFPVLQRLTHPLPGAQEAVRAAFGRNARVAIATNPLFPQAAIRHRIAWAGLPAEQYPFDLVTSFEKMHFAKPRPEYIAETLALLACSPENAIFAGNDAVEDIAPAAALGVRAYHVLRESPPTTSRDEGTLPAFAEGLSREEDAFPPASPNVTALPIVLMGNLAAISGLLRDSGWRHPPVEEGWGAVEIACHLRDYECEILQPRLKLILADDNPYLSPVSSDTWPEERQYAHQNGEAAVLGFMAARCETIRLLTGLDEAGWFRPARHAVFGPTTLAEQVRFVTRHDLLHVEQLQASLAACPGK
jgi:FMN phosphatase YigB (HAD superfamily)